MLTSEQVLSAVDAAEQNYGAKDYDKAAQSVEELLGSISDTAASGDRFPSAILIRLASLLRTWGKKEDDGSDQYKKAEARITQILNQLGEKENDDSSQHVLAQYVLNKAFTWYSSPADVKLINEQGWLYFDRGWEDKARDQFLKALESDGAVAKEDKINALIGAGASLRRLRRFSEAEEIFDKAKALAETLPARMQIERGWLFFDQGHYDRAFSEFGLALSDPTIADEDREGAKVGQIASRQAEDTRTLEGDEDRGKELMELWRNETPRLSDEDAVTILLQCGEIHSNENRYRAALLAYNLALAIDASDRPATRRAWEAKIDALQWLRRYDEAEQEYLKAQEKFPDSIDLWKEMAYTYYWQKRFPEAYSYYSGEAVKRKFPDLQKQSAFEKVLENDATAAEWTVVSLRKMNKFTDAETKVNEALARFGNTPGLLCEKAAIHFSRQEYEKAIEVFDRALKIDEYNAFAHQWRAASFRKLRQV